MSIGQIHFFYVDQQFRIDDNWIDIYAHFLQIGDENKTPNSSWFKELKDLIELVDREEYLNFSRRWVDTWSTYISGYIGSGTEYLSEPAEIIEKRVVEKTPDWVTNIYGVRYSNEPLDSKYLNNARYYLFRNIPSKIGRGFIHSIRFTKDVAVADLAIKCIKKCPNRTRDMIDIFRYLPIDYSLPKLTQLKSKIRQKLVHKRIDKTVLLIGKKHGQTKEQVEETIIPQMGIDKNLVFNEEIIGIKCSFQFITSNKGNFYYTTKDSKTQKTAPKALKNKAPLQLNKFKKHIKEIKTTLTSHKKRIEKFYLSGHEIPYSEFRDKYFNNNLIKIIAKDLIWNFKGENFNLNLIYHSNGFIDQKGTNFTDKLENSLVSLWHPIGYDEEHITSWREFVLKNEIVQPFKQAFREIYIITDAELSTETYSNRFASHILDKDHVSALMSVRGWSPSGILNYGKATYNIPGNDYKVEYSVKEIYLGADSKIKGSAHISTDQIRFYRKKILTELSEVPNILFTEVMRDVDMFVGVTSIGNDPEWYDRGDDSIQNYWSQYSNAELSGRSKVRSEVLKGIIPQLKISDKCSFKGKYLLVKGNIRSYKIHIGSGNILMSPTDQYLCIVEDRSSKKLNKTFIPFSEDKMLSIIISKAFLLSEDDKIKDPLILRQILQND